jgi:hypothetical protein
MASIRLKRVGTGIALSNAVILSRLAQSGDPVQFNPNPWRGR